MKRYNLEGDRKIDTVGPPLECCEIKLREWKEGEPLQNKYCKGYVFSKTVFFDRHKKDYKRCAI